MYKHLPYFLSFLFLAVTSVVAKDAKPVTDHLVEKNVMVAMRDGVHLAVDGVIDVDGVRERTSVNRRVDGVRERISVNRRNSGTISSLTFT